MKYNAKNMYKSCLRKSAYRRYEDALETAKKYNQRVYFCLLCGKYHLTSKKKEEKNGKDNNR